MYTCKAGASSAPEEAEFNGQNQAAAAAASEVKLVSSGAHHGEKLAAAAGSTVLVPSSMNYWTPQGSRHHPPQFNRRIHGRGYCG